MTSNVIVFPNIKRNSPPQSIDEIIEMVTVNRKDHIEYVVEEATNFMFARFGDEGFNLGEERCAKSWMLMVEAVRSALYKSVKMDHPLHLLADSMFSDEDVVALTELEESEDSET